MINSGKLIEINKLVKVYKTEAGDFKALKDINLEIRKGEFVGIIGKSGSGKSTLINMITGIDHPTDGEVLIEGIKIHKYNESQMAKWRGKNVGVVFQFFQLLPNLTVLENVMLPMDFCNIYSVNERPKKAMELLKLVGVDEQANKFPTQLSGGQQQRVAIARSLANDPPIVVADEPTGNLDSKTSEQVFNLFEELVKRGKTIIMVTHDTNLASKVKRSIVIADGEVIEQYVAQGFPALSNQLLAWITSRIKVKKYEPGEIIIKQGEKTEKLFILAKGNVEVILNTEDGQEIVLNKIEKGHYFGEIELLKGGHNLASVRAGYKEEVEAAVLEKEDFEYLLKKSGELKKDLSKTAELRLKEGFNKHKK